MTKQAHIHPGAVAWKAHVSESTITSAGTYIEHPYHTVFSNTWEHCSCEAHEMKPMYGGQQGECTRTQPTHMEHVVAPPRL